MKKLLYSIDEVSQFISQGKKMVLGADENILNQLPQGDWIAGTTPYFVDCNGGQENHQLIAVYDFTDIAEDAKFISYDINSIEQIYNDGFDNGFIILILPCYSDILGKYAVNAPSFEGFATKPLVGWVAGHAYDASLPRTKTYFKSGASASIDKGVAIHVKLPANKYAEVEMINPFTPGDGDKIEILKDGFLIDEVLVNGQKCNFAQYLKDRSFAYPMVADFGDVYMNTSVKLAEESVLVAGPVFKGQEYTFAKQIDIPKVLQEISVKAQDSPVFSCFCVANYLYGQFEGKTFGNFDMVVTFGEIAYQLVNQTVVYLNVKDV